MPIVPTGANPSVWTLFGSHKWHYDLYLLFFVTSKVSLIFVVFLQQFAWFLCPNNACGLFFLFFCKLEEIVRACWFPKWWSSLSCTVYHLNWHQEKSFHCCKDNWILQYWVRMRKSVRNCYFHKYGSFVHICPWGKSLSYCELILWVYTAGSGCENEDITSILR